ncbi:hypothetical protein RJ639_037986 [Escallonia herrerae]|uniref:CCHC-type domain-containing protein n=1 Tax=Escallonia herrerae TaxID=1293975 RepID=A0AA88WN52_9ASTE|nr:hypothetical protein RJ639_037986 [Escallonia herrerae]
MTSNNVITIGKRIGVLLQVEHSRNGRIGEAGFMRLRVEIALEQPIPKGFALKREGREDTWIQFRYERLPDFCFRCGFLGHVRKWCIRPIDPTAEWKYAGELQQYSPWIRASYEGEKSYRYSNSSHNPLPPQFTETRNWMINQKEISAPEAKALCSGSSISLRTMRHLVYSHKDPNRKEFSELATNTWLWIEFCTSWGRFANNYRARLVLDAGNHDDAIISSPNRSSNLQESEPGYFPALFLSVIKLKLLNGPKLRLVTVVCTSSLAWEAMTSTGTKVPWYNISIVSWGY